MPRPPSVKLLSQFMEELHMAKIIMDGDHGTIGFRLEESGEHLLDYFPRSGLMEWPGGMGYAERMETAVDKVLWLAGRKRTERMAS